jgi:hypothetical protein
MHNHRIVSNGRGGDEDVCCLSASPGTDLPQGGMSIGYVLLDLLVEWQPEEPLAVEPELRCSVTSAASLVPAVSSPSITAGAPRRTRGW